MVSKALRLNGYPKRIIQRHRKNRPNAHAPDHTSTQPDEINISLPYVQGLSEGIRRVLSKLGIKVSFYPYSTLRQILVKPKDPVPPDHQKGVVYKISCKDCHQSYVGQSGRSLLHRLKEHKRAVSHADSNASALAEHVAKSGHEIDWDNAEILDCSTFYYQRLYLESWHIQQQENVMNRDSGILSHVYRSLMF